jgi:hypothetical protein
MCVPVCLGADSEFEAAGLIYGADDYRPAYVGAMRAEADVDLAFEDLAAAGDSDELCRLGLEQAAAQIGG